MKPYRDREILHALIRNLFTGIFVSSETQLKLSFIVADPWDP